MFCSVIKGSISIKPVTSLSSILVFSFRNYNSNNQNLGKDYLNEDLKTSLEKLNLKDINFLPIKENTKKQGNYALYRFLQIKKIQMQMFQKKIKKNVSFQV